MRGVHFYSPGYWPRTEGSSPHARGPPVIHVGRIRGGGIIPACAGSTLYKAEVRHVLKDHPRMRGVHDGRRTKATSA